MGCYNNNKEVLSFLCFRVARNVFTDKTDLISVSDIDSIVNNVSADHVATLLKPMTDKTQTDMVKLMLDALREHVTGIEEAEELEFIEFPDEEDELELEEE